MMKKIICIVLCVITLFGVLAFPGTAEDSADISTSDVMSDLKVMNIGGVKFSEALYPKNPALTHVQILSFLEYGYDYSGDQSDYGIYVYVYNPSCKNIKKSNYNKIQIGAVRDESATPIYRKYQLDEVSRDFWWSTEFDVFLAKIGFAWKTALTLWGIGLLVLIILGYNPLW